MMFIIMIKISATLSPFPRLVDTLMTASIAFFTFLPVLRGLDFEKFLLTVIVMSSLAAGKKSGAAITTAIGDRCYSLFFKENTPPAEIFSPTEDESAELHIKVS